MALAYIKNHSFVLCKQYTMHLLGSAGKRLSEKHAAVEHLDPRLPGGEISQLKYERYWASLGEPRSSPSSEGRRFGFLSMIPGVKGILNEEVDAEISTVLYAFF